MRFDICVALEIPFVPISIDMKRAPHTIRLDSIPISVLSDEQLNQIAEMWREKLLETAALLRIGT